MYARRAAKFKQAPEVGLLFGDVFADQPASTDLVNLTPSINGDGYTVMNDSYQNVGMRVNDIDGFARVQAFGAGNDQGNELIESAGSQWGTAYHAIQEKVDYNPGAGSFNHIHMPYIRSDFAGSPNRLLKNGIHMRVGYLVGSNENSFRLFSYSGGSRIWDDPSSSVTIPYTGPVWIRIEAEIDGANTVKVAGAYALTSGLPSFGDWTIFSGPTAGVPIANQNHTGIGHAVRVADNVQNAKLLEIYVDTDRMLGV